jgi:hypothetical protein
VFNKRFRLCENSEFGFFWCHWLLDVDLSGLQLDERSHKFGPFWRFEEHPIVFTQSGLFLELAQDSGLTPPSAQLKPVSYDSAGVTSAET